MNTLFRLVADALLAVAAMTGFSYREMNIIVYFILIPGVYVLLMDRILKRHTLTCAYVAGWAVVLVLVSDFAAFSDILFEDSVRFLLWFSCVGLDYEAASVVICVVVPAIVFLALVRRAFPRLRGNPFARRPATPRSAGESDSNPSA